MLNTPVLACIEYFEKIVGDSTTPSTETLVLAALRLYQYEQDLFERQLKESTKAIAPRRARKPSS